MSTIEKGSCIFISGWWYVAVIDDGFDIGCICDNANNVYSWEKEHVEYKYTAKEAILAASWANYVDNKIAGLIRKREIPIDVIAEVLAGVHDDRFDALKPPAF